MGAKAPLPTTPPSVTVVPDASWSTPALAVSKPLFWRATALPSASVPVLTRVTPVKVLVPVRASRFEPLFVRPPVPVSVDETVPDDVPTSREAMTEPPRSEPPLTVNVLETVTPTRSTVVEAPTVTAPVPSPVLLVTRTTPPLTVVPRA